MAFFDPTRAAYRANPYPALALLRKEDPVHWSANLQAWIPTRYAECAEVLRDGGHFTTDPRLTTGPRAEAITAHREAAPMGNVPNLGTTSGELHRRLRKIVNPVFTPASVRLAEPTIVRMVETLLDSLPVGRPFDLMECFANPLPKQVMLAMMGFPAANADRMRSLLTTIETTRSNGRASAAMLAEARAAQSEATEFIAPLRGSVGTARTVLDAIMQPKARGEELSVDEATSVLAHISTVGADPTSGGIANGLAALAAHPQAIGALRSRPEQTRATIPELLRYDSPTHIVARFAAVDTRLGGRRIRRGDVVLAVVGAANRDPATFNHPDDLDITRDARRQLAFGQGEHICLGAPLAVTIMEAAIKGILRRFKEFEVVSEPQFGPSVELRVPDRMMVRCA